MRLRRPISMYLFHRRKLLFSLSRMCLGRRGLDTKGMWLRQLRTGFRGCWILRHWQQCSVFSDHLSIWYVVSLSCLKATNAIEFTTRRHPSSSSLPSCPDIHLLFTAPSAALQHPVTQPMHIIVAYLTRGSTLSRMNEWLWRVKLIKQHRKSRSWVPWVLCDQYPMILGPSLCLVLRRRMRTSSMSILKRTPG